MDVQAIVLEHDILGDHLDADEVMGVLRTLASMADDLNDKPRTAIGTGSSAKELWDEAHANSQSPEGTGPVVSA